MSKVTGRNKCSVFRKKSSLSTAPLALIPTESGEYALEAIYNIQQNCQFYNYEIFCKQLPPVVIPQPSKATVTYNIDGEIVQIIEENKGTVIGEQNLKAQ
ncbi:MAG: hypothetical protein F6K31_08330 [Symploca sp. SIO2G7]|nr:hypothetical protein [Symploca sp. SIO2G7]